MFHTVTAAPLARTDNGVVPDDAAAPTLLYLHGWCGDRHVFDDLLPRSTQRRALSVDLPGHGESAATAEPGYAAVLDGVLATLDDLGVERVVPVGLSHAGWAAIDLRERLGSHRVPGVVVLDWMVLGTPPGFMDALAGLQSPAWADVRAALFAMWTTGVEIPALAATVASMGDYGQQHWRLAGHAIAERFGDCPVPLDALERLQPCPTLHLYAQPGDDAVLAVQQQFAAANPWFEVTRLDARSHFPMFEVPDAMADAIEAFVARLP